MTMYRNALPQLNSDIFLTDGGLETTLIFDHGLELPCFAAFDLIANEQGIKILEEYYRRYATIAINANSGFILESATWRANPDWASELGYNSQQLHSFNIENIQLMEQIRDAMQTKNSPMVISGNIGPRGDGYIAGKQMTAEQSSDYHSQQISTFAETSVDMITALTMTYPEEAIGIVNTASSFNIPSVVSFTTETDGRLPNGLTLQEAIEMVDRETDSGPAYYMINCAHPDHYSQALKSGESWVHRIRGMRANSSRMSHAELDEAEELDPGNPIELGQLYHKLRIQFPHLTVLGGCCGTDHRHIEQIQCSCMSEKTHQTMS